MKTIADKQINLTTMLFHRHYIIIVLLACCPGIFLSTGCTISPAIDTIRVESANYDDAFDSVMDALRYERYTLDRVDRRLGVITTVPLDSASIVEPWQNHNSTVRQAAESTLHHERRIVRVEFQSMSKRVGSGGGNGGGDGGGDGNTAGNNVTQAARPINQVIPSPAPIEPAEVDGLLFIDVVCTIERAHMPGRQIQTSDLRRSNFTIDPALAERGIPGLFWEPIARDPYMEQRIKNRIARIGGPVVVKNFEAVKSGG